MIRHHRVDAADFLRQTHDIGALHELVRYERGLERLLRRLPGRKILLTNAPTAYSTGVLRHIGLQRHFAHHVAIEDMHVHRQLRPKPSTLMLRPPAAPPPAGAAPLHPGRGHAGQPEARQAARRAHRLGHAIPALAIRSASSPKMLKRPAYVDVKVKSVLQLPRAPAPAAHASRLDHHEHGAQQDNMASTKPGQRKLQILQALAAMLEHPKGERSPPRRWPPSWRCRKRRCTATSPARRRCSKA